VTLFAPRAVRNLLEEELSVHRRDLFAGLSVVFPDATSLSFTGAGARPWGRRPGLSPSPLAGLVLHQLRGAKGY
jgi:hypothetical protein